ncbi:hypothetical protein KIL84_001424 [Mauremys mutica]|uniref:Uncharacterized protein n=1 Tax=Mauremys mutica TaxID=74926 RepID=A0A9D3WUI6_9SAUR|nr:hypothetical protein KIL84_001424 [Mauremys mutica]
MVCRWRAWSGCVVMLLKRLPASLDMKFLLRYQIQKPVWLLLRWSPAGWVADSAVALGGLLLPEPLGNDAREPKAAEILSKPQTPVKPEKTLRWPGKWGGDGFINILEEETEELIKSHRKTLTNEELEELIKSSTEDEDDDDEKEEPASWNHHTFAEVFQAAKHLNDLISEYDPSMERSLKITRSFTDDLRPY